MNDAERVVMLAMAESLAAEATPGPWTARTNKPRNECDTPLPHVVAGEKSERHICGTGRLEGQADAAFIAHARIAVPDLAAELRAMVAERDQALHWEDVDDEWSSKIHAAHPVRSGSHEAYGVAMQMVGHRHSKGQLVSLVNWLLAERDRLRKALEGMLTRCPERCQRPLCLAAREALAASMTTTIETPRGDGDG
jgi:hypothetical protein